MTGRLTETGMRWVPVFFFIWLIAAAPATAGDNPAGTADPFSCPVHYEESKARIALIRAEYERLSADIDREIDRVRGLIIAAGDPAAREELLAALSDLERRRAGGLSRALTAVGDIRVEDRERHISDTIALPPPTYMAPDRLLAGTSVSDIFGPEVDLAGYLKIRLSGDISRG